MGMCRIEFDGKLEEFRACVAVCSKSALFSGSCAMGAILCSICTTTEDLRVEYEDLVDAEDENIKLQEWIVGPRQARTDELQMRCRGRLTIRPTSSSFPTHHDWVIGSSVDVWLWDAWWEGVVTKVHYPRNNSLQVYFPGERFEVTVETKYVRVSRDWVNGRWIDINPKPDILSYVSSAKLSKK